MEGIFTVDDLTKDLKELKDKKQKRKGVSTGFEEMDELMTIDKGYLSVVSGYPSSGKSEYLDAILDNCAILHGWKTLYYSPENFPIHVHLRKHVERLAGSSLYDLTEKQLDDAITFCKNHFKWMYPENDFTLDGLLKLAAIAYEEEPFDCLVIDPWNEVDHSNQSGSRDDQYIGKCLTKLRRFIREHNIHAFVVAHPVNPSKQEREENGNYKQPTLNEISGGATWRAKCDYGWVAHRHPMENVCKIIVQKIKYKDMGQVGSVEFDYDRASGRFKHVNKTEYIMPNEIESPF